MVSEPQITRIIGLRHSVKETSWLTTNEATCGGSRFTTNEVNPDILMRIIYATP